jgi:sodium-dependent dicarboxylate transporter 2/3/5
VILFLGGFLLALGIERVELHLRFATVMLRLFGSRPAYQVLGILVVSGLSSMWISNTATAMMMLPVVYSLTRFWRKNQDESVSQPIRISLLLALAYGCTIGGIATPIGSPPNALLIGFLEKKGITVSFLDWFIMVSPVSIFMGMMVWIILVWVYPKLSFKSFPIDNEEAVFLPEQQRMEWQQWTVLFIFLCAVFGWVLRGWIPDTQTGFQWLHRLGDAGIALSCGILVLLIPGKSAGFLCHWTWAVKKIPWGILILFGGGLSLAFAMEKTGLTHAVGGIMQQINYPMWLMLFTIAIIAIFASEIMSNTAQASMIYPIIAGISMSGEAFMLPLLLAGCLGSSLAFMLPAGTPPNAVVFGSHELRIKDMMRAGLYLNLIAALVIASYITLIAGSLLVD